MQLHYKYNMHNFLWMCVQYKSHVWLVAMPRYRIFLVFKMAILVFNWPFYHVHIVWTLQVQEKNFVENWCIWHLDQNSWKKLSISKLILKYFYFVMTWSKTPDLWRKIGRVTPANWVWNTPTLILKYYCTVLNWIPKM